MLFTASLYIATAIFTLGLIFKVSAWFRCSLDPAAGEIPAAQRVSAALRGIFLTVFSAGILTILRVLVSEVLLQTRALRESSLRWWMHMLIFGGFMLLLLIHGLDKYISLSLFSNYYPTLNPFLFLRNLSGLMVVIGLGLALYRRAFMKIPRLKTAAGDHYAIAILAIIMVSGMLLEGIEITSHTRFREMAEEYAGITDEEELKPLESLWVKEYGVVSPKLRGPFEEEIIEKGRALNESCIDCHSRPQWAFLGYGVAKAMGPVAGWMDKAGFPTLLRTIHFLFCFIGLAYLPFSKMFHVIAGPISLLANAVMDRETSHPANIATRQMMELDACTHCGACTQRCSVGVVFEEIPNANILPSEKIASLKALASGRTLSKEDIRAIREGLFLCTNCLRCTGVCPVGINLQELWFSAREALLLKGCVEPLMLTPLSLYRGLIGETIGAAPHTDSIRLTREFISNEFKVVIRDNTLNQTHRDDTLKQRLRESSQSDTFTFCYNCKTCTSACPLMDHFDNPQAALGLVPHQIMHALSWGLGDLVMGSRMLWACLGCYRCQDQCPQGVHITDVFYGLKNLAVRAGNGKDFGAADRT